MAPLTWQMVRAEALRRIGDREWMPGQMIPHEADLATELGCARATVNRALRDLASAGLLERRRKAGTRVPLNPVRKATFEIPIIRQDIEGRGHAYGYQLLLRQSRVPDAGVLGELRLPPGTQLIRVSALHSADGRPFCFEDRWINPVAVPELDQADLARISANEWLVQNTSFSGGDISFGAVNADPAMAERLSCPPGTALLTIGRTTWAGSMPITSVSLTYMAGHRMRTTI
ncbi:MAG: UTRA domain-containing protein [Paracoccaceae bacterium]|nr:MAG: UTRA domain-containing protein [Paracoccaceae bacterium]